MCAAVEVTILVPFRSDGTHRSRIRAWQYGWLNAAHRTQRRPLRRHPREGTPMISVTVCIDNTWTACETDAGYSPDLLDDLTSQAAATTLAAVKADA